MTPLKLLLHPLLLILALCAQAFGQVDVRMEPIRRDYLLGESAAVRLIISNHTDSPLELKSIPGRGWLYLSVSKRGEYSPLSPSSPLHFPDIKVLPGSRKAYTLDLQPFYRLNREGTYRVVATVRMPDMQSTYTSNAASFNMVPGATLRSFVIQVRGMRLQMNVKMMNMDGKTVLFGQVLNPETRIALGACFLAQYLNFMEPRILLDRAQNLHVLCQSTADFFTYAVMDTQGVRRQQKIMKRTGGPIDLISTGSGIRCIGLAEHKKDTSPNSQYHRATERP